MYHHHQWIKTASSCIKIHVKYTSILEASGLKIDFCRTSTGSKGPPPLYDTIKYIIDSVYQYNIELISFK